MTDDHNTEHYNKNDEKTNFLLKVSKNSNFCHHFLSLGDIQKNKKL
jgi:hypothetical protein